MIQIMRVLMPSKPSADPGWCGESSGESISAIDDMAFKTGRWRTQPDCDPATGQ